MGRVGGIEAVRVFVGLMSLADRHPTKPIEHACEIASSYGSCLDPERSTQTGSDALHRRASDHSPPLGLRPICLRRFSVSVRSSCS